MIKITKNKNGFGPKGPWFRMPREITLSSELNPYQYRMLAVLLDRDDLFQSTKGTSWFWCNIGWLVAHSGMGRTKADNTLRELEEMGFISITSNKRAHMADRYHINWDVINAYQRPLTQEELESMDALEELEELAAQEQTCEPPVSKTTSAAAPATSPKSSWKQYLMPFENVLNDPYYIRGWSPKEREEKGMPFSLPENNHYPPAKEWYCASNRQYIRETYFPTLLEMELSNSDNDTICHYVYAELLHWVLPCVKEDDDARYVWFEVIKPDFEEYKKEQIALKQTEALQ